MLDRTNLIALIHCLLSFAPATATPVLMNLDPGGGFDVTFWLSTGVSDTEWSEMTGSIQTRVGLDITGEISKYVMTGGRLVHADTTMLVNVQTGVQARFSNTGVATQPITGPGGGSVSIFTGLIDNTGHSLISNEGISKAEVLVNGMIVTNETRNLAANPDTTALSGTTYLTPTVLATGGWWQRVRIDLSHFRVVSRTYLLTGYSFLPPGTTYSVLTSGGFGASGTAVFPGEDFMQWAVSQRNVLPESLDSRDPASGQPLLVMYSLRAGSGGWQVPVVFDTALSQLSIHLPVEGTRTPLRWESWTGNTGDPWLPLIGTPQASGMVPAGSAGVLSVPLPGTLRGFVRVAVPTP
jgi:hypothetical protein